MSMNDDELKQADAVVIVTDHSSIDYQRVVNLARVVVDTRNATAGLTRSDVSSKSSRTRPDLALA